MTSAPGGAAAPLPPALTELVTECAALIRGFSVAGHRLYLVGGIVRDLVRGAPLDDPDFDFTTDATPTEVKAIVGPIADSVWNQGERFGTIAALFGRRLVEITTHRAEAYDPESRKPEVVFSDDIGVDLSRRDFTVNAMAVEVTGSEPRLIDPYGGHADLVSRRLRTPLEPAVSFSDDPLRMLRAARFVARLGLVPESDVVDAITAMRERLAVVSVERIRDEFEKLLGCDDPLPGLALLRRTELLAAVLPELDGRGELVVHLPADPRLRLALLLSGGSPGSARERMRALKHSRHDIDHVGRIVGFVDEVRGHDDAWPDPELRRLAWRVGSARAELAALLGADLHAPSPALTADALTALVSGFERLGRTEDLDTIEAPLDGRTVMQLLGVAAGPDVGAALTYLLDLRLERGPLDDATAASELVRWWDSRNPVAGRG